MSNEESQDVKSLLLVIDEKDRIIGNLGESLQGCRCDLRGTTRDLDVYKNLVVKSQVETYNELKRTYDDLKRSYDALERKRSRTLVKFSGVMEPLFAAWAFAATTLLVIVLAIV